MSMKSPAPRTPNNASGFLALRLFMFLSSKRPSAQERQGDRRLDEARDLAQRNEDLISSSQLKIAEDKLLHATEIKVGLESRSTSGPSRILQAREYRKAAKEALRFVKTTQKGLLEHRPVGLNSLLITTDGSIDLRLCAEMKPKVSPLVEHLYPFKTGRAPESIRSNVELAKLLLRDMNFIYPEACDRGKRHGPYSHPIIQEAINVALFRHKDDVGVVYHEHFSPMPIPVIAAILTVVQWCIDEWSDGQRRDSSWNERTLHGVYSSHISTLFSFQAQGLERNTDVLCQLQCDLLRNAREHAGVPHYPIEPWGRHRFTLPDTLL